MSSTTPDVSTTSTTVDNIRRRDVKKVENFFRKAGKKIRLGITGQNKGRRYRRKSSNSSRVIQANEENASGDDEGEEVTLGSHFRKMMGPVKETEHNGHSNISFSFNGRLWKVISRWENTLRKAVTLIFSFALGASFGAGSLHWILTIAPFIALCWIVCLLAKIKFGESGMDESKGEYQSLTSIASKSLSSHVGDSYTSPSALQKPPSYRTFDTSDRLLDQTIEECDHHPDIMYKLFILNSSNLERILPNSRSYNLDTDFFTGTMFLMIRTPDDVSDYKPPVGSVADQVSDYFKDKRRQFEFQFQIKLKKLPTGPLFLGCEIEQPLKLGLVQRALVSAILGIVQKMNAVHFSYGIDETGDVPGQTKMDKGEYERAHLSFGLEDGMDRIVVTKPGETPPKLGQALHEDPESIKNRKKNKFGAIHWNLEDTYTMAFWSAYVNFIDWKVIGLPGIRPFSISSMIGELPLTLTLYSLTDCNARYHLRRDMHTFVQLEISHAANTRGGLIDKYRSLTMPKIATGEEAATEDEEGQEPDDLVVEVEDNDADENEEDEINDLGDGLYLRSGEPVVLCDANHTAGMRGDSPFFVAHHSGFALLQSYEPSCHFVFEKASRQYQTSQSRSSSLICDGDTVIIKIIRNSDIRYLSTHHGWWLKFVKYPRRNNGFFHIFSRKASETENGKPLGVQSPYVSLDSPFSLRHQRWSHYEVGVSDERSVRVGGKLLGLRRITSPSEQSTVSRSPDYIDLQGQKRWLRPLLLCAQTPTLSGMQSQIIPTTLKFSDMEEANHGALVGKLSLDAFVWIEMMHRSKRRKQLAYIVRVSAPKNNYQQLKSLEIDKPDFEPCDHVFFRVRTGRDLTPFLQLVRTVQSKKAGSADSAANQSYDENESIDEHFEEEANAFTSDFDDQISSGESSDSSVDDIKGTQCTGQNSSNEPHTKSINLNVDGEVASSSLGSLAVDRLSNTYSCHSPKKAWIASSTFDRLTKSVRQGAVFRGKNIVRQGLKAAHTVEKGAMKAGKGLTKGINVSVKPREVKKDDHENHSFEETVKLPLTNLAGMKLSAEKMNSADQSLQLISQALLDLIAMTRNGRLRMHTTDTIFSSFLSQAELDRWFLRGDAAAIGVLPLKSAEDDLLHGALIARALWDTHWREEWCEITATKLDFYAPLSNRPVFSLALGDIDEVRKLDLDGNCHPLPGLPLLVLETAWRCHYLAFVSLQSRENFISIVNKAIFACIPRNVAFEKEQNILRRDKKDSFCWQSYQAAVQASLSNGRGKWKAVATSQKKKHRAVLNGRCMGFDVKPFVPDSPERDVESAILQFVEDLLSLALSLDQNSFSKAPDRLLLFLNNTSRLSVMPINQMEPSGKGAYCVFVNLFHCLLQHALLFSIYGPPNQRSIGHFMRCSSYEVGGNVYSLVEIESIILRGNLSRAVNPKAPFVVAPKEAYFESYSSLTTVDARINFLLNHGTVSDLPFVLVLRPETLDDQINHVCSLFLKQEMSIDKKKRIIMLPKVCEVYRKDFGDSSLLSSVLFCMQFLRDEVDSIMDIINEDDFCIKFNPSNCIFQYCLKHSELEATTKMSDGTAC